MGNRLTKTPELKIRTMGFVDRSKYQGDGLYVLFMEDEPLQDMDYSRLHKVITLSPKSARLATFLEWNRAVLYEECGISLNEFLGEILQKLGVSADSVKKSVREQSEIVPVT